MAAQLPEKPTLEGIEERLIARWEQEGTYRFDRSAARDHVFSYTQTDTIARYQRMRGRSVFYPIGWDDNGLATERRVQNFYGVRCDPSLPYDPDFTPPPSPGPRKQPISRPNFVELCRRLTDADEQ